MADEVDLTPAGENAAVSIDPATIAPPPAREPDPEPEPTAFNPDQLDYVQGLRKENADRRVAVKGWEEAFSSFDAQDQSWIQETFRLAANSDPTIASAGVARIDQMKNILLGTDGEAPEPAPVQAAAPEAVAPPVGEPVVPTNPEDAPITVAQFKRWQEEQAQETRVQTHRNNITEELVSAGFPERSPEYRMAIEFAREDTNGDLKEAIAMVGRYQQAIRDSAVGAKTDQRGRFPSATGNVAANAPADPATQEAPSWETARASLEAMIDAQPGEAS